MQQQIIDALFISSMVFFNLLCILGIIATIAIMMTVSKTQKKVNETLDSIKDASQNVGEIAGSVSATIAPFIFRRKSEPSWLSVINKFFG